MTTDRRPRARALGASIGLVGRLHVVDHEREPVTATRAEPARGSSSENSMARNRASGSTLPAIRWPRTTRRPGSTTKR